MVEEKQLGEEMREEEDVIKEETRGSIWIVAGFCNSDSGIGGVFEYFLFLDPGIGMLSSSSVSLSDSSSQLSMVD